MEIGPIFKLREYSQRPRQLRYKQTTAMTLVAVPAPVSTLVTPAPHSSATLKQKQSQPLSCCTSEEVAAMSLLQAVYAFLFLGGIFSSSRKASQKSLGEYEAKASGSAPSAPSKNLKEQSSGASATEEADCSRTHSRKRTVSFSVKYTPVKRRYRSDRKRCKTTHEEVGVASGSEQENQKSDDEALVTNFALEDLNKRPEWVPDKEAPDCHLCACQFNVFKRRHHCRACGEVFCDDCSTNRITLPRLNYTSEVRVCNRCWVREAELRYRKKPARTQTEPLF